MQHRNSCPSRTDSLSLPLGPLGYPAQDAPPYICPIPIQMGGDRTPFCRALSASTTLPTQHVVRVDGWCFGAYAQKFLVSTL